MSYEDILKEDGRFRVKLVLDECPDEPYDEGQSPLMRMDYGYYGWRAEHIMTAGRPTDADGYVETAAARCGTNFDRLTRYLIIWHGATQVIWWHSGSYWYITYDTAAWREHTGAPEHSANMDEYRAWCEGDVWGYIVQKRVTWSTEDPDYPDEERWEDTGGSCWGFYGRDYAEECALGALTSAVEAAQAAVAGTKAPLAIEAGTGTEDQS